MFDSGAEQVTEPFAGRLFQSGNINTPSVRSCASVGRFPYLAILLILSALYMQPRANAQWPQYPESSLELFGMYPKIISDMQGGIWVIVTDGLHHVNREGFPQWNPGSPRSAYQGRFESSPQMIVRDDEGGVYVVSDIISDEWDYENEPNHHVHIQYFNADGEVTWGAEGIRVNEARTWTSPYQAVTDDTGGLILSYNLVDYVNEDPPRAHYYAQRISPEGDLLWEGRGYEIGFIPNSNFGFSDEPIFTDGQGGAYIIGHRDGITDRFILKLTSGGAKDWTARVTPDSGATLNKGPYVDDGEGGLIYAPCQNIGGVLQTRMVRFNTEGDLLWEVRPFVRDTVIVSFNRTGDCLFAVTSGGLLYRFNLQGEPIWDTPVSDASTVGAITEDGLCMVREVHLGPLTTLIAQKISNDREDLWNGGVGLEHGHSELIRATDDNNGGIIIVAFAGGWMNCILVNRNGEMGIPWNYVPPTINPNTRQHASIDLYPNPSRGSIQVLINLPGNVLGFNKPDFTVYDIRGREVQCVAFPAFQAGIISIADIPTGQYILRVKISGKSLSRRFIVHH